jgi:hypothetical protein
METQRGNMAFYCLNQKKKKKKKKNGRQEGRKDTFQSKLSLGIKSPPHPTVRLFWLNIANDNHLFEARLDLFIPFSLYIAHYPSYHTLRFSPQKSNAVPYEIRGVDAAGPWLGFRAGESDPPCNQHHRGFPDRGARDYVPECCLLYQLVHTPPSPSKLKKAGRLSDRV